MDEVVVDMHVQLESKLFPQGVHHLERLFWLLAAVRELSNHGERVVAWRYTSPSHVGKHFLRTPGAASTNAK